MDDCIAMGKCNGLGVLLFEFESMYPDKLLWRFCWVLEGGAVVAVGESAAKEWEVLLMVLLSMGGSRFELIEPLNVIPVDLSCVLWSRAV